MKYKLKNVDSSDLNSLNQLVELGAKFIVFNYRIGLGFVSLNKFSPAILINNDKELEKYKWKYNRLNFILGPWTLPSVLSYISNGDFFLFRKAYRINKAGGIDVTKDVMCNLNTDGLLKNEVDLIEVYEEVSEFSKKDIKDLQKFLKTIDPDIVPFTSVYGGMYTNTDSPFMLIGFELKGNCELNHEYIKTKFYKYFYKHVVFESYDLSIRHELGDKIREQGGLIYTV